MVSHPLFLEHNSISDVYVHLSDIADLLFIRTVMHMSVQHMVFGRRFLIQNILSIVKKESDNVIIPGCTLPSCNSR